MADDERKERHPQCPQEICGRHQGREDCSSCEALKEKDRFVRMCLGGFLPVVLRWGWRLLKRAAAVVWWSVQWVARSMLWLAWEFSGLRAIWEKIHPPPRDRNHLPAPTFFLWFVGIYVALFGLASQRYENSLDRLENRTNIIITQLGTDARKTAISLIAKTQGETLPKKPRFSGSFMGDAP